MNEPVLTTLDISIGDFFLYDNFIWTRTDRYSAICSEMGACYFGFLDDNNGENNDEWNNVLTTAVKLDRDKVENLILNNIEYVK